MEQQKKPEDREDDIIQAFRVFDADNKGYIESAELRELLENMDWKVSAEDLKDLITSANLHQDRKISIQGKKLIGAKSDVCVSKTSVLSKASITNCIYFFR